MRPEVQRALEQVHGGDPSALDRALRLLQNTVFSFSMKVCGHRQDAEDTMQDTLLKTARHLHRFDSPKALAVWLYKVAKNHCLMSRRKSRHATPKELSLDSLLPDRRALTAVAGVRTPERELLDNEAQERVRRAVLELPPSYRLPLVLHDMEGLSNDEVARVLDVRPATVRVRLHRARVFVRNQLHGRARRTPRPALKSIPRPGNCKQLFAELSDYLDGVLDDSACQELEQHMDGCAPCQVFLQTLSHTVERSRRLRPAPLDPKIASRTRKTLLAQYQRALAAARAKQ